MSMSLSTFSPASELPVSGVSVLVMGINGGCSVNQAQWDESAQRLSVYLRAAVGQELEPVNSLFKWRATLPGTPPVSFFELELLDGKCTMPSASQLVRVPLLGHLLLYAPLVMASFVGPLFGSLNVKQLESNWSVWLKSTDCRNTGSNKTDTRSRIKWGITSQKHVTVFMNPKSKHVAFKRVLCEDNEESEGSEEYGDKEADDGDDEDNDVLDDEDEKMVDEDEENEEEEDEEEEEEEEEEEDDDEDNLMCNEGDDDDTDLEKDVKVSKADVSKVKIAPKIKKQVR